MHNYLLDLSSLDWLSIAFVSIMVIFMIVGLIKGFANALVSLLGGIVALAGAILLAKPAANALKGSGIESKLIEMINNWLIGINEGAFNTVIPVENQAEAIGEVIKQLGIPDAFNSILVGLTMKIITIEGGNTIGYYIGSSLAYYDLYIISSIVIYIAIKIVVLIIKIITKNFNKIPVLGFVNRLVGLVFGLVEGFLVISAISYVGILLLNIGPLNGFISSLAKLNDPTANSIAKWFFENNLIKKLVEMYL